VCRAQIVHDTDEGIREGTNMEGLAKLKDLKSMTSKGKLSGMVTAGLASQICDGAAAVLICNEAGLKKLGVKVPMPTYAICNGGHYYGTSHVERCSEHARTCCHATQPRAKIIGLTVAAADPVMMLSGPIPATEKLFEKTGMKIEDIDLYEVNEAFAPVPLAWAKALHADLSASRPGGGGCRGLIEGVSPSCRCLSALSVVGKLNVNGGAMALGHPLGGTGVKLMTTLLHELERTVSVGG
jgi:acetyl-CoA C-acetyltransferase